MTNRLLAYIENAVTKNTFAQIERATGVSADTISEIAVSLATRLNQHHRFPVPRILGIDGLKVRKTDYNVIADAVTGWPIGIVLSMRVEALLEWMNDYNFDAKAVEILSRTCMFPTSG